MIDCLVIGAGLSGLMAAHTAASSGLSVRVVNKGLGAMHWSAGTIDLLGYTIAEQDAAISRPFDALARLTESQPTHPYALTTPDDMRTALGRFQDILASAGLVYQGAADGESNLFLPSPAGGIRPAFLAPEAQMGGDLGRDEPMLIVGFDGMRDFYPQLIADNLNKQGHTARPASLPMNTITDRRDSNTVQLATGLEDRQRLANLGRVLKQLVQPGERIGLPAILGVGKHAQVLADLTRQTGATIYEIPTLPPSVPGVRLYAALRQSLQRMGVRIETSMEVIGAETTPSGSVAYVSSETTARPMRHRARGFVLATGGVLGGGFYSDYNGRIWETIFNLPLTLPQDRSQWFNSRFLSDKGHPVYQGGVAVNANFQPVDADGQVVYDNLWAAGQLLADTDPILERSLEGNAIISGMAAGKAVAHQLNSAAVG